MEPQSQQSYAKCVYVADLRPGEQSEIREWFLITKMDLRMNPRGPSLSLAFADRTGEIPGIWWDADYSVTAARVGDIVRVRGVVGLYNERPQLAVSAIWLPPPTGSAIIPGPEHFFKRSKHNPEEMWDSVGDIVDGHITGNLGGLVNMILAAPSVRPQLLQAPAAKAYHHAYLGGLLEHILSLMQAALALREHYVFDLPLVLAACVLHDIGKLRELEWERGTRYTVVGTLHGHVAMGFSLVERLCDEMEVEPPITIHLLHLIASHHGAKENGAPVEPATREALIFHALDKLDAHLAALDAALEAPGDDVWTPYIPALKGRFLRPTKEERNDE